jgi:hypothetical protein
VAGLVGRPSLAQALVVATASPKGKVSWLSRDTLRSRMAVTDAFQCLGMYYITLI